MIQSHYRNFLFALVLIVSTYTVISPITAFAEEIGTCDPNDPTKCALQLEMGSPAPFTGQLLTPNLALDLSLKANTCDERLQLELKYQKALFNIDLNLEKQLRKNDEIHYKRENALLTKRLEEAHYRPFYEHPIFVAAITAAVVLLTVYGTAELMDASRQ